MKEAIKEFLGGLAQYTNVLEAISSIVTIVSFGFSVVSYFQNQPFKTPLLVFIISLVVLLAITFFKNLSHKATVSYICINYYKFLHDFRNRMNEIELHYKDETITTNSQIHQLTTEVKVLIEKSLNYLVESVKTTSNREDISACVKLIDYPNSSSDFSLEDTYVSTFVRDSRCPQERLAVDESELKSVPIIDNTAFLYFFKKGKTSRFETSIFYQGNLIEYDKFLKEHGDEKGYCNTTPNWDKYYQGTAVVPIRIKTHRIEQNCDKPDEYTILGYLCIDSEKTGVFTKNKKDLYSNILKSYAALLFQVLYFYTQNLNKCIEDQSC